ncbi:MAG: hypothetical protein H6883_08075 [Rhodobiaceae bacterium]|nr:hypothetical protein [Rhodobiaceae bacterium]MCC0056079.1 hypothetical protein [Rhodobiaceae bacterium]
MSDAETIETSAESTSETTVSNVAPSWRAELPEDMRANPSLMKFENAESLAKSYLAAEKLIGQEKVPVPKTDADWERWYRAAGRPDRPEDYAFAAPDEVPEGITYDETLDRRLAGLAHEAGLNRRQAERLRSGLMEMVKEGGAQQRQAAEAAQLVEAQAQADAERELQAEWGSATMARKQIAARAVSELFPPEVVARMEAAGLGNEPAMVKAFYDMGVRLIGEKQLIGEVTPGETAGDLDAAISAHRMRHATALTDRNHPDHSARLSELTALYDRRFG